MKKLAAYLFTLLLPLSLTACSHLDTANGGADSFGDFLQETKEARPDDYLGQPGVRVLDETAFDKMKEYLINRYKGVHVTHSFEAAQGEVVDCLPISEQMSLKGERAVEYRVPPAPKVPSTPAAPTAGESGGARRERKWLDLTLKPGERDAQGDERYCRQKTIPVRRVTLDDLVRFPTLEDFFDKGERRDDRTSAGTQHYYARGIQYVDNLGASSWLNVWNPAVAQEQMSLSQIWVTGDTGNNKQAVEAGWQVYPERWDSDSAALFIYHTTGGYRDGTGCYNLDCSGFIQVANDVYLGSGFEHYSASREAQWGFELQYKRNTDGNWWLLYRGPGEWIPVGYYPQALFGNGRLASKGEKVAFGGEATGSGAAKQMGSGATADEGFARAAFQETIFYIDTDSVSQWAKLSKEESAPNCYTTDIHNIYGSWGSFLYFGGPRCP